MNKTFQYLELIVGSLLYPVAINLFLVPAGLNSGGLIGFAQILSWLFMGSTAAIAGVINFCFNIPLFWLAYKNLSMGFIRKTVLSLVIQTVAMQSIPVAQTMILPDVISNALLAGVWGAWVWASACAPAAVPAAWTFWVCIFPKCGATSPSASCPMR